MQKRSMTITLDFLKIGVFTTLIDQVGSCTSRAVPDRATRCCRVHRRLNDNRRIFKGFHTWACSAVRTGRNGVFNLRQTPEAAPP